jgi:monoamine oxidase
MYFAGTETGTQWSGYMDGAIQAGERAAREIMARMGLISPDLISQTEPPSKVNTIRLIVINANKCL